MRRTPFTIVILAALAMGAPALAQPWASEAERSNGRLAFAALQANRFSEAEATAQTADPLVAKYMLWSRLQRSGAASASELVNWLSANPDWPFSEGLARRTEEALQGEPDDVLVLTYFSKASARTLAGAARYVAALQRRGQAREAENVLKQAWLELPSDAAAEAEIGPRVSTLLSRNEQWMRFDRLSMARDTPGATRQMAYLAPEDRQRATWRLAYAADTPDAPESIGNLTSDLGLLAERARWLRRHDRDGEAAATWALAVPLQKDLNPVTQRTIWTERQILARKLLRLGDPRLAYTVAAEHGQTALGEARNEAEFLAGFIALRRLNDPARAAMHFARLGEGSTSVITRARAAYWQAVAATAMGDVNLASARYRDAAGLPIAFYGQLSALALGDDGAALSRRILTIPTPEPNAEAAGLFVLRELTRVVLMLSDLGEARRARTFLLRLEETAASPTDQMLTARLALHIGRPDNAVWVARRAWADGTILLREGWPSPYQTPEDVLEPALTKAIARQESNFDPEAVSSANARGLMQLLPGTAAQVAKRLGVTASTPQLTRDPSLNLRLGSAYLAEMLDRFGGNLAMAAAAYNAGPRRVQEWVDAFGDPNSGAIPLLDWIELIPFTETRNYVQRVVENAVVYRALDPGASGRGHPLQRWITAEKP
ncbi:lytic transglycosylase domain-containing protein [Acetobacteraceae bacterium H6797]|nr:lytic transglycosylase domain-containing protein [Acetobacteraceae bacterium H6797]